MYWLVGSEVRLVTQTYEEAVYMRSASGKGSFNDWFARVSTGSQMALDTWTTTGDVREILGRSYESSYSSLH